ncbi:LCP family protein [Alicyclobacillus fodiniaquatilis]|uniref:LCP family protein n=1 Tax=Alicyclobacillus fodiniaquatilis TaxID=1661150 RepID=A0ABW4JF56_9BACL
MSERPHREKSSRLTKYVIRFCSVIGGFVVLGGVGAYGATHLPLAHSHVQAAHLKHMLPPDPDRETILLIGTDARIGDPLGNSDVLCVVSLDDKHRRVEMMSIPRDTQVAFPDGRYHKINDALLQGGPSLTLQMVENLIGLPVDHYAVTRFDGLVNTINRIGGIDINVPARMHYYTGDKQYGVIDLKPGQQHLNGEQALAFVRFRHDALGDIGRTERQQAFLTALKQQLLRPATIPKLPGLLTAVSRSVDSDMTLVDMGRLASQAQKYAGYKTIHETLPGSFHDPNPNVPNDLSYWVVNPRQARYAAKQFFADGIVQQNPVQDPAQTHTWTYPKLDKDK